MLGVMSELTETTRIEASVETVWRCIEDLEHRPRWDVAVLRVERAPGEVGVGTEMTQVATWRALWSRVTVRYTRHEPPRAATVELVRGPWFFAGLTAGFELEPDAATGGDATIARARYHLAFWPAWLAWAIAPIAGRVFALETTARWQSLARYAAALDA